MKACHKQQSPREEGFVVYGAPGGVLLSRDIPRTIIGAEAFHGPVRDGKAWDHLAMAAKQSLNTAGTRLEALGARQPHANKAEEVRD